MLTYGAAGQCPLRGHQVFSSVCSQDVENAPETTRVRWPDSASSTYITNFLHSPSLGRSPQWDPQRGSAPAPHDGVGAALKVTVAFLPADCALLNDYLFSMSWHDPRLPSMARPLH